MAQKGKHLKKKPVTVTSILGIAIAIVAVIFIVLLSVILAQRDTPDVPNIPDIPDVPDEPDVPDVPLVPDKPVVPDEPDEPVVPDEPDEPEEPTEPEYTGFYHPLTGEKIDEDISMQRPYAVMVNNIKVATPQAGISEADIIFETLAEGGITRLLALYQDISEVDTVGSVRSSRPYYLDMAQAFDAIYIHAGGSDDAYQAIKDRDVAHIDGVNGSGETFFRDSWRRENMGYEHSLMLDPQKLPEYIASNKMRAEHKEGYEQPLTFKDEAAPEGAQSEHITVTFSKSKDTTFDYSADNGLYTVSQYGGKMTDSDNGAAVRVKNVIVIYTSITKIAGDDKGRMSAVMSGGGKGYFACDGSYTEIKWSKLSSSSPFEFELTDGTDLELGRGSTYICIVPVSGGDVSFS